MGNQNMLKIYFTVRREGLVKLNQLRKSFTCKDVKPRNFERRKGLEKSLKSVKTLGERMAGTKKVKGAKKVKKGNVKNTDLFNAMVNGILPNSSDSLKSEVKTLDDITYVHPRVCFSIIMRNECHVLPRMFENIAPFVKYFRGAVSILDNGSTDNSVDLAKNLMRKYQINGEVIQRPWYQFSVTRTEELRHSENVAYLVDKGALGVAGEILKEDPAHIKNWIFDRKEISNKPMTVSEFKKYVEVMRVVDRDYTGEDFLKYALETHSDYKLQSKWYYIFTDVDNTFSFNVPFDQIRFNGERINIYGSKTSSDYVMSNNFAIIIDPKRRFYWKWKIHENIVTNHSFTHGDNYQITVHSGTDGFRSSDPLKYLKDALVCEEELIYEPDEHRYRFYLAQSYKDARKHKEAIINYKIHYKDERVWVEERHLSAYYIADLLMQDAGRKATQKKNGISSVKKAVKWYNRAFNILPGRREAPYMLSKIDYGNRLYSVAYYRLKPLYSINETFKLSVNTRICDYEFYTLGGDCCIMMGNYMEAYSLYHQSLNFSRINQNDRNWVAMKKKEILLKCSKELQEEILKKFEPSESIASVPVPVENLVIAPTPVETSVVPNVVTHVVTKNELNKRLADKMAQARQRRAAQK